jgi:hypothetical protein
MSPARSPRTYTITRGKKSGRERANWEMTKKTTPDVIMPKNAGRERRTTKMMTERVNEMNIAIMASLNSRVSIPIKKAAKKRMKIERVAKSGKISV